MGRILQRRQPLGRLVVVSEPSSEPLTTAEAKLHLCVEHTQDDALIDDLITAARRKVENDVRRTLINTTYRYDLDEWGGDTRIDLPRPPLSSVSSITYYDVNSTQQTWAATNYQVDTDTEGGGIVQAADVDWPTLEDEKLNAISITFVAGYGSDSSSVPEEFRLMMRWLIAGWYQNRESVLEMNMQPIPYGYTNLLHSFRAKRRVFL